MTILIKYDYFINLHNEKLMTQIFEYQKSLSWLDNITNLLSLFEKKKNYNFLFVDNFFSLTIWFWLIRLFVKCFLLCINVVYTLQSYVVFLCTIIRWHPVYWSNWNIFNFVIQNIRGGFFSVKRHKHGMCEDAHLI